MIPVTEVRVAEYVLINFLNNLVMDFFHKFQICSRISLKFHYLGRSLADVFIF